MLEPKKEAKCAETSRRVRSWLKTEIRIQEEESRPQALLGLVFAGGPMFGDPPHGPEAQTQERLSLRQLSPDRQLTRWQRADSAVRKAGPELIWSCCFQTVPACTS